MGRKKLSKEIINERLMDRGITMTGEYTGSLDRTEFTCSNNHTWIATPGNVTHGTGCPYCTGTSLSKEIINGRLMDRGIIMTGEYTNSDVKTKFECIKGHMWEARPSNVLSISGCPSCAEYGFNPSKEAWEYILDFGWFLKFGITNNLSSRLGSHKKNGEYRVVHERHHQVGQLALDWENHIKKVYGGRYVTKEQCPDGWTETLCISLLYELMKKVGNTT